MIDWVSSITAAKNALAVPFRADKDATRSGPLLGGVRTQATSPISEESLQLSIPESIVTKPIRRQKPSPRVNLQLHARPPQNLPLNLHSEEEVRPAPNKPL